MAYEQDKVSDGQLQDLDKRVGRSRKDLRESAGGHEARAPGAKEIDLHAPPAERVPKMLPPDVAHFIGRSNDLETLNSLLIRAEDDEHGDDQHSSLVVITGTPGVGKTALAVHWARRILDRFPGGQLYADLGGDDKRTPLALRQFLHGLGVPPAEVIEDTAAMAGQYRSQLAGRRILIVLDNAATASQVLPLLPGTGSCVVLVTSRSRLYTLTRYGAQEIPLDLLAPSDAIKLLRRAVGAERFDRERAAGES